MNERKKFIARINSILVRDNLPLSLYQTEKLHLLRIKRKYGNRNYTLRNGVDGVGHGQMYTNMMAVERIMEEIQAEDARDLVIAAYFYGG